MKKNVYFVSGMDTGIGKSYATGFLAHEWNARGIRTITQKFIQTGNTELSEDIELHRRLMGIGLLPEDHERLTMPEIFTYPCSPHLAAEIDGRDINFDKIERAMDTLSERYDAVLLEGAGGLMVPLTPAAISPSTTLPTASCLSSLWHQAAWAASTTSCSVWKPSSAAASACTPLPTICMRTATATT